MLGVLMRKRHRMCDEAHALVPCHANMHGKKTAHATNVPSSPYRARARCLLPLAVVRRRSLPLTSSSRRHVCRVVTTFVELSRHCLLHRLPFDQGDFVDEVASLNVLSETEKAFAALAHFPSVGPSCSGPRGSFQTYTFFAHLPRFLSFVLPPRSLFVPPPTSTTLFSSTAPLRFASSHSVARRSRTFFSP